MILSAEHGCISDLESSKVLVCESLGKLVVDSWWDRETSTHMKHFLFGGTREHVYKALPHVDPNDIDVSLSWGKADEVLSILSVLERSVLV